MLIKFFIMILLTMIFLYYLTVVIHLLGWGKLTFKEVQFKKAWIPFYYWVRN